MSNSKAEQIHIEESHPPSLIFALANPLMKLLLASPLHGLVDEHLILLSWQGHKSGRRYTTPVGYHRKNDTLVIFTFSGWKANFRQPHPVKVKIKGEWREGVGEIDEDPRRMAEFIKAQAEKQNGDYRRFRMEIEGDRPPTIEELIPEIQSRGMALIDINLDQPAS